MKHPAFVIITLLVLLRPIALADGPTEAMFSSFQSTIKALNRKVHGENIQHLWSDDGNFLYAKIWDAGKAEYQWFSYDLATGDRKPGKNEGKVAESKKLKSTIPNSSTRQNALSPDKSWTASVSDGAIILTPKEGAARSQTYELPEGSQWQKKFQWAPDSSACVAWHVTSHPVTKVHYIRSSPEKSLQPEQFAIDYPKAGDRLNIPRPVIFFTDGSPPMELDAKLSENPFEIRNLRWHPDSKSLTLEYTERGFGEFTVIEMDVSERKQRALLTEKSDTFVYVYGNCFYHELANGNEALWLSQRTGYNHLYLVDRKTGKTIRPLTGGRGLVREIIAINEKARTVTASVAGIYPGQDPYFLHYIRIGIDDGKITHLTEANGTHEIFLQPNGNAYIDKWSRVDQPPVHEIRRLSDGKLIVALPAADLTELKKFGWIAPEPFVAKDRNGKFDIHGVIIRPIGFDPSKKYPVIEQITNVDPSSTYQVVDALIKADKDFDYIMVPGANHGVGDSSKHLRRKRIEFFQKHLQLPEP